MVLTEENRSATLLITNPKCNDLDSNPGFRCEGPATNHLSFFLKRHNLLLLITVVHALHLNYTDLHVPYFDSAICVAS